MPTLPNVASCSLVVVAELINVIRIGLWPHWRLFPPKLEILGCLINLELEAVRQDGLKQLKVSIHLWILVLLGFQFKDSKEASFFLV